MRCAEEGRDVARSTGFLEPEANSEINIGLAALELGDPGLARDSFNRAEDIFARDDWYRWRYRQRLELGWAGYYASRSDWDRARDHAEKAAELAINSSRGKHLALAYCRSLRDNIRETLPSLRLA